LLTKTLAPGKGNGLIRPWFIRPEQKDERAKPRRLGAKSAVVLGYDVARKTLALARIAFGVMQAIVMGMTGSGKDHACCATSLRRICFGVVGTSGRSAPHSDDYSRWQKADMGVLPQPPPATIHRAGRLSQLRILNPSRPNLSVRYNPFHCSDENYMPVVNMVFGSFKPA